MKLLSKLAVFFIVVLAVCSGYAQVAEPEGARDFFNINSGRITRNGNLDFKFSTIYRTVKATSVRDETIFLKGNSIIADLRWNLRYGFKDNMELYFSGVTFMDNNKDTYRYGAGDTKLGMRWGFPREESQFNAAVEGYYMLKTGFNEGPRLMRSYTSEKGGWGSNMYLDFNWNFGSLKVNGGYYNNLGGMIREITTADSIFWYRMLDNYQGISKQGEILGSHQIHFGLGGDVNLFKNIRMFGEYNSNRILAKEGESKSLGSTTLGFSFFNSPRFALKIGVSLGLTEDQPGFGSFIDLKFNGILGRRRRRGSPIPVIEEREPVILSGRKPFFYREGVVFSQLRQPIRDTVFLIDASPSMIGRGLDEGRRGEDVLRNTIDFVIIVIDSAKIGSNISVITFADKVSNLTWREVNDFKKEDLKNSVRDIPDEVTASTTQLEEIYNGNMVVEKLTEGLETAYKELESFQRTDYNRIHIQRIIIFTDAIMESPPQSIQRQLDNLARRFHVGRDDFKYIYLIHTNPRGAEKLPDELISFVEKEDGKVFRKIEVTDRNQVNVGSLQFNNISDQGIFKYLSQITKLAVIGFNTKGKVPIGRQLTESFEEVFDYNEYFQLSKRADIERVLESEGLEPESKIDLEAAQSVGKKLGVDYIVLGEIVDFKRERDKGLYVPFLIGFPKTQVSLTVSVNLVDVKDGFLSFVDVVSADYSYARGISLFPTDREEKTEYLSALETQELYTGLLKKWQDELIKIMFEDVSVLRQQ